MDQYGRSAYFFIYPKLRLYCEEGPTLKRNQAKLSYKLATEGI